MQTTINVNAGDMALVVTFVLLIGGVIKNFTPLKNELIPLITWALGGLLYQTLAGGWSDIRQWMMALISVAGATGLHSATRSTAEIIKPPGNTPLLLLLSALLFTGCMSVPNQIITVKEVGDSVRREYAVLYQQGLITPEQDARAERADEQYRQAMAALAVACETAQITGDASTVPEKLRLVKSAITPMLDLIWPMLNPQRAQTLSSELTAAVATK